MFRLPLLRVVRILLTSLMTFRTWLGFDQWPCPFPLPAPPPPPRGPDQIRYHRKEAAILTGMLSLH